MKAFSKHALRPGPPAALVAINPLEEPKWDKLVRSHPDYCFFHSRAWGYVLRETYGHRPAYFASCCEDRLSGLLAAVEADSLLRGRRGVSLPFADFCPVLTDEEVSEREILSKALAYGRKRGWAYLEWRCCAAVDAHTRTALSFHGHTLDLSRAPDAILARCDGSVRRAIRRAEREGVRVEFSTTLQSVRQFYRLYCRTRKKHGLPPQGFKFFEAIQRHALSRELGFVALAWHDATPIAAAVFLHLGNKAVFKFGASLPEFLNLRGNNLVMWEAIKWYSRNGYSELHFGRTSLVNSGLRTFKRGWGTKESAIGYFRYDLRRDSYCRQQDDAYGWHTAFVRVLPQTVARLLGACLYRHWA